MEEDWVLGTSETPGVEGGGDYEFCQKNGFYIREINKRDTVWWLLLFFTHYFFCGGSRLLWIMQSFLVFFTSPESGKASSHLLGQRPAATSPLPLLCWDRGQLLQAYGHAGLLPLLR